MTKRRTYSLFYLLYFAQGAITAYQLNFFKPHLHGAGISTEKIATLASLVLLPFVVKVLFGLMSDRINLFGFGHRIPYILTGVLLCAFSFLVVFFIDPSENFIGFAAVILLASFSMALFDSTTDAYAVDIVHSNEYLTVQSYMTAGRAMGFTILSLVFGLLATHFGYSIIFLFICLCLLLPVALLVTMPESAVVTNRKRFEWGAFRTLLNFQSLVLCVSLFMAWFIFQGIDGTITFYLSKSLSATTETIGQYGTIKGISMVFGAVLVFILSKRFGLRVSVICTLTLVTISGLVASFMSSLTEAPYIAALLGVTAGFHWTVWMSVIMRIADLRIAGSTIAIYQMMSNIGIAAGEGIATNLTESIGFDSVFFRFALFNLAIIPIVFICLKRYSD